MKLWLDLELRADIDDLITLIFALENKKFSVEVISIHNPSINELNLLEGVFSKYKYYPIVVINGKITYYNESRDIHSSTLNLCKNYTFKIIPIQKYLETISKEYLESLIYFAGGSLNTFSKILDKNINMNAYIQGGYAGESVVGKDNVLEKFKGREQVPSWNMNLDLEATNKIVNSKIGNFKFISKNICHSSFVNLSNLTNKNSFVYEVLKNYFTNGNAYEPYISKDISKNNLKGKCMHDVLAFFAITHPNLIKFKNVDLIEIKKERSAWKSILNENSNKQISISYDYNEFLKYFNEV